MPKKQVLQGGGIIVYGEQVVLRRNKKGKWLFPKGHLDLGESTAQAALREAAEETGLQVELVEAAGAARYKDDDEKVEVDYFILRASGPGPHWEKHYQVDTFLVPPDQVAAHLSFGKLRRLWDEVQERVTALTTTARP